jgi:hypothetical protein
LSSQWEGRYVSGDERGRCDLIIISIPVQITNKQAEEPYTTTALAVLLLKTHTHTAIRIKSRPGSSSTWGWGGRKEEEELGLGAEDADLVEERDVLRAVLAADVAVGHGVRVLREPLLPAAAPQLAGVAPVRVVCDGAVHPRAVGEEHGGGREALVVRAGDALQLVQPRQPARRDGVELARHAAARPGQVEEEGHPVRPAHQRERGGRGGRAHERRVARGGQVLQQRVVGEAALQRAVGEHQRPLRRLVRRAHRRGWLVGTTTGGRVKEE